MHDDTPLTPTKVAPDAISDARINNQPHPNGPFHSESLSAVVPASRVINVTLPPDFPIGPVEVVLISKTRWRDSSP